MAELIGWVFLFLYIFIAYRFLITSIRALIKYFRDERRPYEIISGRIVDFEQRRVSRPKSSGKQTVFYPVFEYEWKGRTHRKFARRVPAAVGPGLTLGPRTRLSIGDAVDVRIYPRKPSDARIDEPHYFWRSRIWGQFLAAAASGMMLVFGVYSAICRLIPG